MPILLLLFVSVLILSILYAIFLGYLASSWQRAKGNKNITKPLTCFPKVAVIIPARNEAATIRACVNSIRTQSYPKEQVEIIVVDDHSTDATVSIINTINDQRLHLLRLTRFDESGKKVALQKGITHAQSELLVTTDADVVVPPGWLEEIVYAQQAGSSMILGPVKMAGRSTLLTAWQGLDVAGTMLLTGAAVYRGHPILANGANFAFTKALFTELGGYQGNENRASGDDIFLLQKAVLKNPNTIRYLFSASAAVVTLAEPSWKKLFWQRLRWAGKTGSYRDPYLIVFQAMVYLLCLGLIAGTLLLIWWPMFTYWVLASWVIKLLAESVYLYYACREIGEKHWLWWLFPVQLLHPVYILLIGTMALLPFSFYWKGRKLT